MHLSSVFILAAEPQQKMHKHPLFVSLSCGRAAKMNSQNVEIILRHFLVFLQESRKYEILRTQITVRRKLRGVRSPISLLYLFCGRAVQM
jgi:predicted metal-binding protein